ncbi:hypothetical protein [Synechococcus phage DSL-LC03]|nr:hypothetical protein [Synechococcus phage DSL-LC03]
MQPDRNQEYMKQMWGTDRLITDYGSLQSIDIYEEKREFIQEVMDYEENVKKTNNPPNDRFSRPCGGKGGFDDYVERWH